MGYYTNGRTDKNDVTIAGRKAAAVGTRHILPRQSCISPVIAAAATAIG
jgi:hypothetical protein